MNDPRDQLERDFQEMSSAFLSMSREVQRLRNEIKIVKQSRFALMSELENPTMAGMKPEQVIQLKNFWMNHHEELPKCDQ